MDILLNYNINHIDTTINCSIQVNVDFILSIIVTMHHVSEECMSIMPLHDSDIVLVLVILIYRKNVMA